MCYNTINGIPLIKLRSDYMSEEKIIEQQPVEETQQPVNPIDTTLETDVPVVIAPTAIPKTCNDIPKKKKRGLKIILTIIVLIVAILLGAVGGIFVQRTILSKNVDTTYYSNLFNEYNLVKAKSGEKCGYINKEGKFIINPIFDSVSDFSEGLAAVEVDDKYGYINSNGEYIVNPQFSGAGYFSEGLARVLSGDKCGYIDKTGKFVINPQFDDALDFSENLACVKVNDKYGVINKSGEFVVNAQYDEMRAFSNGLAAVKSGDRWGYIDKQGNVKINFLYVSVTSMNNDGYAIVATTNKKYTIINKNGEKVCANEFDGIDYQDSDFCAKENCYETVYSDEYCSAHKPSTTTNSYSSYCDAYGCYNKAYIGDYCTEHWYFES